MPFCDTCPHQHCDLCHWMIGCKLLFWEGAISSTLAMSSQRRIELILSQSVWLTIKYQWTFGGLVYGPLILVFPVCRIKTILLGSRLDWAKKMLRTRFFCKVEETGAPTTVTTSGLDQIPTFCPSWLGLICILVGRYAQYSTCKLT